MILGVGDEFLGHDHPGKPEVKISVRVIPSDFSHLVEKCVRYHYIPSTGKFERVKVWSMKGDCWHEIVCEHCGGVIAVVRGECVEDCSWEELTRAIERINSAKKGSSE